MEISLRHMSPATPWDPQHLELLYERADARKNIHGGLFQQSHSRVRLYCYSTSAQHLGVIPAPHLGLLFPELLVGFCCTVGLWGGWVQLAVLWDVPSVRAWGGSCASGILNSCPSQSSEDEKQRWVAAVGLPSPPHTVPAASLSSCLRPAFLRANSGLSSMSLSPCLPPAQEREFGLGAPLHASKEPNPGSKPACALVNPGLASCRESILPTWGTMAWRDDGSKPHCCSHVATQHSGSEHSGRNRCDGHCKQPLQPARLTFL